MDHNPTNPRPSHQPTHQHKAGASLRVLEGQQWETEEAIENEMKWGDSNADDTEETMRQHDAQRDGSEVNAEDGARDDEGGTTTCDACEKQAGGDDSRGNRETVTATHQRTRRTKRKETRTAQAGRQSQNGA